MLSETYEENIDLNVYYIDAMIY